MRKNRLIIYCAVALHFCWAIALLRSSIRPNTTAIFTLYKFFPFFILPFVLILAGFLSLLGIYLSNKGNLLLSILFLIPQQLFLTVSAIGATEVIITSRFADGVLRPWNFIFVDQIFVIIFCVAHTLTVLEPVFAQRERERERE